MDWVTIRKEGKRYWDKYKLLLLILALGIFLMNFPGETHKSEPEQPVIAAESPNLEQRLQEILGAIQGVGEVRVLLTESSGEQYHYQMDEQLGSDGSIRGETVIIRDENRGETGLLQAVVSPSYQGAIVVCQGGANALVKLSVIEAVGSVTGIPSSRITVLKMN